MSQGGASQGEARPEGIIYREFDRVAGAGWQTGTLIYRLAGKVGESSATAKHYDGRTTHPVIDGFAMDEAVEALRAAMARPGTGAWFTATIHLTVNGSFSMDVDYDNEPDWRIPVVPATYGEEQEQFPRDREHQPEWYQQKLREAGAAG